MSCRSHLLRVDLDPTTADWGIGCVFVADWCVFCFEMSTDVNVSLRLRKGTDPWQGSDLVHRNAKGCVLVHAQSLRVGQYVHPWCRAGPRAAASLQTNDKNKSNCNRQGSRDGVFFWSQPSEWMKWTLRLAFVRSAPQLLDVIRFTHGSTHDQPICCCHSSKVALLQRPADGLLGPLVLGPAGGRSSHVSRRESASSEPRGPSVDWPRSR